MSDVCGAFIWLEAIEQGSDAPPGGFDGSLVGFSDEGLELGEHHLDGIEVGTVWRQEQEARTDVADGLAGFLSLVASQIVEDDDIALGEGGNQGLLDPGREGGAVDGPVQDQGSYDAIMPQPGQEGECLPMAVGHLGQVGLTARTPAAGAGHVGFHPGFVDEDQAAGVNPVLMGLPARPEPGQLRPILLLGHQRFF